MMEKQFVIARRKRFNLKFIIALAVLLVFWLLHFLDDRYSIFGNIGNPLWLLVFMVPFLFVAFFVDNIKNHKVAGQLFINPSEIKIEKRDVVEIIPVEEITGLEFRFKCVSGETPPSNRFFGLWSLAGSSDGSGNYLYFWFNDTVYNLNIVLESTEDLNAVLHLFRMIEKTHGFRPVITGYSDDE